MQLHSNEYKKLVLFHKVHSNKFFLFGYFMGTQGALKAKSYKESLEEGLGLKFCRYRDSFLYLNNKPVFPLLEGEFFFFFPKNPRETLATFRLKKVLQGLVDTEVFSHYFVPYCLGTKDYLLSFDKVYFFQKLLRRLPLKVSLALVSFFFFFTKFLILVYLLLLKSLNGYFNSISKV